MNHDLAPRAEQLRKAFADDWKAGRRPRAEDVLQSLPPAERDALLRPLLEIEVSHRLAAGESLDAGELLTRFPQFGAAEAARMLAGVGSEERTAAAPTPAPDPSTLPDGRRAPAEVGPRYRIRAFHARGGLGEVFRAEDSELGREVALKRIQPRHLGDPRRRQQSLRRFEREAEITGRLEHPGIVPIYGLVRDEQGHPCYAMRFIQGRSFKEAIDAFHDDAALRADPGWRRLELRKLLSRFASVCDTMAYAHSKGVIHRDLKPANVMLGPYGETLVIDWGLAKELRIADCGLRIEEGDDTAVGDSGNPRSGIHNPQSTQAGHAVGTPAYMSPEQASGLWDRVGPASDVYSLGATLYQLLTGSAPTPARHGLPEPPRQRDRSVPPALDAVCRRAMALDPAARYATAMDLREDVERWLADEPVSAYREPWAVRARRWARRHRTFVTGAVSAIVVALVLGGWVWWRAERDHAEQVGRRSGEARELLAGATAEEPPGERSAESRYAALKTARATAERALAAAESGPVEDGLRERAAGEAGRLRGAEAEARREVEQRRKDAALVKAADEARQQRGHTGHDWAGTRAGAGEALAAAFAADGLDVLGGEPAETARRIRGRAIRPEILSALDFLALEQRDAAKRRRLLALARLADDDAWRNRLREALERGDVAALSGMAAAEATGQPAASLALLANELLLAQRPREALDLLRRAQRQYPNDFWINYDLADLLRTRPPRRADEARGFYRAALAARPDSDGARVGLALALVYLKEWREAAALMEKATALKPNDANAHHALGAAYLAGDDPDRAAAAFRRAAEISDTFFEAHYGLATALASKKNLDDLQKAIVAYRRAVELRPEHADIRRALAEALIVRGDGAAALRELEVYAKLEPGALKDDKVADLFRLALELAGRTREQAEQHLADLRGKKASLSPKFDLGVARAGRGDIDGAVEAFRAATAEVPWASEPWSNLGVSLFLRGDRDEARAAYERALELRPGAAEAHYSLGNLHRAAGEHEEARAAYEEAARNRADYAEAHCNLGHTLRDLGRFGEALDALRRGDKLGHERGPAWKYPSPQWVRQCEQLLEIDKRLGEFLAGKRAPQGVAEALLVAEVCRARGRPAAAVKFYGGAYRAIAADPKMRSLPRSPGALAALRVARGDGDDAGGLSADQRRAARRQALEWLRTELNVVAEVLDASRDHEEMRLRLVEEVLKRLPGWQAMPALAPVRDADQLRRLPAEERAEWEGFWADVEAQRRRARAALKPRGE